MGGVSGVSGGGFQPMEGPGGNFAEITWKQQQSKFAEMANGLLGTGRLNADDRLKLENYVRDVADSSKPNMELLKEAAQFVDAHRGPTLEARSAVDTLTSE